MARRRTRPEHIKNKERYFSRYIAKEVLNDRKAQREYNQHFCSLEERLEKANAGIEREILIKLAVNMHDEEIEKNISDSSLLGWIDFVEDQTLCGLLQQLSYKHQVLLSLRYQLGLSQQETAVVLNLSQSSVSRQEKSLLKFFREKYKIVHKKQ